MGKTLNRMRHLVMRQIGWKLKEMERDGWKANDVKSMRNLYGFIATGFQVEGVPDKSPPLILRR